MDLHYLTFDFSDEESGRGSFDAMASVLPERLPALLDEVGAVLRWAHADFGAPGEDADWDYGLQATLEPDTPLPLRWDAAARAVRIDGKPAGRTTVTFTIGGTPAFCRGLQEAFGEAA
jgi:hypothetical protein